MAKTEKSQNRAKNKREDTPGRTDKKSGRLPHSASEAPLRERIKALEAENRELRKACKQATDDFTEMFESQSKDDRKNFIRGVLPNGDLIKTNLVTGKYEVIDREEWDTIPAK